MVNPNLCSERRSWLVLFSGFIISDDTELCDKIISQDVENEQRRRNLAKSFVAPV